VHLLCGTASPAAASGGDEDVGEGRPAVSAAEKGARREVFKACFLAPPAPPKVAAGAPNAGKKRRRGVSGPAPDPAPDAAAAAAAAAGTGGAVGAMAAPATPFAALLQLLHSTLELNEQLPVYRNLALGHQVMGPAGGGAGGSGGGGGGRGGDVRLGLGAGGLALFGSGGPGGGPGGGGLVLGGGGGNVPAKLASGLNMLAAPLRLTLRRAPRAPRAVTDLSVRDCTAGEFSSPISLKPPGFNS
jgi:hypothetical protein